MAPIDEVDRCDALPGEPGMWMVALDVEGTLFPEAWLELQQKTGLEELKRTTAHEPDYDKLMRYRIDVLRREGLKLQDMKDIVGTMEPLPGCIEFLGWLKSVMPRVLLLTDTFEEYAMPIFEKLGAPSTFCHSLVVDEDGYITGHTLRLRDQKRKAVEAFQRLNFRVIAVGDSFNDVSMMRSAERGFFLHSSAKVENACPEFPVCKSYDDLKGRIMNIVLSEVVISPRELVVPSPPELLAERTMWLIVLNVAGTLAPEPWPALAAVTGNIELATTTASVCDLDTLMQTRAKSMRQHGIKLQKLFTTLQGLEPLPGAKDFLAWLKPIVPRTFMITDGFEEYAEPVFKKLGHPAIFCNFLEADSEGFMTRHVVRLQDQKRRSVEEFQRLNFRIMAVGHSFCDIAMLKQADHGILLNPSKQLLAAHPEIPSVHSFEDLKGTILDAMKIRSRKRKSPEN
jgi:phosphoserine/homoserine phosphotransferase